MRKAANRITLAGILIGAFFISASADQTVRFSDIKSGTAILNQDRNGLTIAVDIGSIEFRSLIIPDGEFTAVGIDGFARSQRIGEPNLPMINKTLTIPLGCELSAEVLEFEIEEIDLADYGLTSPIVPVQPSLSKSENPGSVPFEYNRAIYNQNGYYGLPLTETSEIGIMRALKLGEISVAPVEYNPESNSLRVYKRMVIRVNYLHPDWSATTEARIRYFSPFYEPVYDQIFNYEPLPPTILDDLVTYPVKYVIIADRMFEAQLQPFIAWKVKKGFQVITGYTDDIGGSNTAIKAYIRGLYENSNPPDDPAPSFVLLVGDHQQIPAFDYSDHISDLDFCEFTGDHNPEIYYGRFSAQNTSQLQPQIDKTLEYEQYLMPDPSYLGNVTMIAGVDPTYAPTHGNGQINYGTNIYFNSEHGLYSNTWLYPASNDPGAAAAIRATVNQGVGFINYTAHGSHDGWANPEFSSSQVGALTNVHKYTTAVGNCCLTCTFGTDYSTPCAGEVWLQSADKGAVGYIGGSNSSYWDEDYYWGVGYGPIMGQGPSYEQTGLGAYDGVFHDHAEPVSQRYVVNDALVFCGNMAVQESGSSLINYYWEIYHLMGDPSVSTYLGVPTANTVQQPETIVLGANTVHISADPASYIGLSKNGVFHGGAYVDESGVVDMSITPFDVPGTADIVITGQNKEPYVSTIQVIAPSGPYVIFDSSAVNDSVGNNNNLIDFGEAILLDVQLMNVGPDTAFGVFALLTTEDEYVTITDSVEVYGTIAGDLAFVNIENAYGFDVAVGVPDRHSISFSLTVSDANDETWGSNFTLQAHAPVINFVELSIDDNSGNGNGIFEAGETAEMTVTLINSGSSSASSVTGVLSSNDEYVTISDANGSFGDLDSNGGRGDNSTDVYIITAHNDYPPGHSVLFGLALQSVDGYAQNLQFILRAVESFEYDDGGWVGDGSWQWGEPGSGPGSAYDGTKVWATNLTEEYPDNADDRLYTKYLTVEDSTASIGFYHWYSFESGWDGGNLCVSSDAGASWEIIVPEGGYPDQDIIGLDNEPGFSSESGGWMESSFSLADYEGMAIRLRFRMGSDGSVTDDGWYIDAVNITGVRTWSADSAELSVSPISFNITLDHGNSTQSPLTISNNGSGLLVYGITPITIGTLTESHDELPAIRRDDGGKHIFHERTGEFLTVTYDGPKTEESDGETGPPTITDFGGPDEFGYMWIDSNEPQGPDFEWVDISVIGQPLTFGDDQNQGPFDMGFSMPFYNNYFGSIRICSNGWLSFTSSATNFSNSPIPGSSDPNNLIAPFWDDLNPSNGGSIYFYTNSTDSAIVEYSNIPRFAGGGSLTFEVILTSGGDITFQYLSMEADLSSCTVGIENGDGSIGLQAVYDGTYVENNLATIFKLPAFWLFPEFSGGYALPGQSVDLDITFDATELNDGRYTGYLRINSNDPDNPVYAVYCTLTVGELVDIDDIAGNIPSAFSLNQNYPNPFNPSTSIQYALPEQSHVTIIIYDILGRQVERLMDRVQPAGYYDLVWNASDKRSGVYFARLETESHTGTIKMVLLK